METRQTILVVDDEPVILKLMVQLLKNNYQVKVLNSGERVLAVCKEASPPDLILLDVSMPGKDGFAVLKELKADKKTQAIPVIFVTARIDEEDEQAGFDIGAVDYIQKPIRPAIVRSRVKAHIDLKRARDHLEDEVDIRTKALQAANLELKNNFLETVKSFSYLIEQRDPQIGVHSRLVAERSRKLAAAMGLEKKQVDDVFLAGLLYRIGSLSLPEKMNCLPLFKLHKPARDELICHLSDAHILFIGIRSLRDMASIIESQFEHFGGTGLPAGKSAEKIPLGARILAVVRDYDLLLKGRLSDKEYSSSEAVEYLRRYSGRYYDPKIVDVFIQTFGRVRDVNMDKLVSIGISALVEGMDIVEVKLGGRVYVRNLEASASIIEELRQIQQDTGRQFEIIVRSHHLEV